MEPYYTMLIPPVLNGPGLKKSFLISEEVMNLTLLNRVVKECANDKFYHKVMVFPEEEYRRDFIVKTLLDFLEPATFSPVLFRKEGKNCFFFVKSCQSILLKLVTAKFKIKIPNKGEKFLKLKIICNFIRVEALEVISTNNLSDVLKSRYDASTKTLDLSCFCDDESLLEYCPLYLSRNMVAVTARIAIDHPKSVDLRHNHLTDIGSFYSLQKDLESLDLRNNQIKFLKDLKCLKYFTKLKSLYLDGNPLCALYDNFNYVIEIKGLCSSLEFIDGERIVSPPDCQKNFLRRLKSKDFADQFMRVFFTLYDSDNRMTLKDLYDKNALLSVSAVLVPHKNNSSKKFDLNHYGLNEPFLVYGVEEIMKLYQELPKSRHYPYQFTCDVTLYESTHAAICITGVYWEHKQFISFLRYFLLNRKGDKFTIINEQLTVTNATKNQRDRSVTLRHDSKFPYFPYEYGKMELALRTLTKMNRTVCQKFLYHCEYDLNKALQVFCEAFANDRIPSDVFVSDGTTSNDDVSRFSDLIIQKVSKTSQTITEQTVWKFMEMKRLKRCLCHEKVKSSSINKIFHMRHVQKSTSSEQSKPCSSSVQFKTMEKPEKVKMRKPICFKLSASSVLMNKETKGKQTEEAIKENTLLTEKSKKSKNIELVDKSDPKTLKRSIEIFLKNPHEQNITSLNPIGSNDAKLKSISTPSKTDSHIVEGTVLKSNSSQNAHDTTVEKYSGSKKRKRTNNDDTKQTAYKKKVTKLNNEEETVKVPPLSNVVQPEFQPYLQNTTSGQVNSQTPVFVQPEVTKTTNHDTKTEAINTNTVAHNNPATNATTSVETVQVPFSHNAPVVQHEFQYYPQNATNVEMNPQTLNFNQYQPQFWDDACFQQPMIVPNNPYMFQPVPPSQTLMPLQQNTFQCAQTFPTQQPMQFEENYYPCPFSSAGGLATSQHGGAGLNSINPLAPPGTEGDILQPQMNEQLQPVEIRAMDQTVDHHKEGISGIEKMLHTIIRQLKTDNQTMTISTEASINNCVQVMLSFIQQLETLYKINGGNRTIEQPVMIKRVIPVAMEEDLAFSILHVILHEMFEYESCKYDHSKINLCISDEIPLCSNKIYYFSEATELLNNIREKLYRNQSLFDNLRFKTEPSPVEHEMKSNQFTVPYILRASNKFEVFSEILKKALQGRGAVYYQDLAFIPHLTECVITYFKDPTNILAKRRLDFKKVVNNYSVRKGIKSMIVLTVEAVVHIIIHELIENSTCSNNKSEDFLKIPNLPPICHNTIYRPTFKIILDDIQCLLRQSELKQRLLYESKQQEDSKTLSDLSLEATRKQKEKNERLVLLTELFNGVLIEICSKNSIGTQQILMDECNLPFFARTIASLVHYLDNTHSKKMNQEFLNGVVRLLDKQESVNHNFATPTQYLISLSKSIIHVVVHEMFEYIPCTGYVLLPDKLVNVLRSLNEKIPVEKLLCQDEIYQMKHEHLRTSIRQCLSKIEHHFEILKLTAQPFTSIFPIYNVMGDPSACNSNHNTDGISSHVPTAQIKDLPIEKQVSKDSTAPGTSAVQINVHDEIMLSMNYVELRAKARQPLKNVVNIEKHLLGQNVSKTIIIHFLKLIAHETKSWPKGDSQATDEIFDALAESFILNVRDLIENPTIPKDLSSMETKDDSMNVKSESKIEVTGACEPDPSEMWINKKLREKYETLTKEFNENDRLRILKTYTGLLHVVTHEILEQSTCDSTNPSRNATGNSNIRSVICTDNTYRSLQHLDIIRRVIYEGENVLKSGSIPLDSTENVIVLSRKSTILFGPVPETTLNLEVFLMKNTFIYIIGKCLLKYFCRLSYLSNSPHIWQDLDELAEKMTFVMQHYYSVSLKNEDFAIGPIDAALKRKPSPFLFHLAVGILEVIGNNFAMFKKNLNQKLLIDQKLSVESCYLPVGKLLREFVHHVLIENIHLFPSWLECTNHKAMIPFFKEPEVHENVFFFEGIHEELANVVQDVMLLSRNDLTPEDSALVNHFAEKISFFLKRIRLMTFEMPLTDVFYNSTGIVCPPKGPRYAQVITRACQILMHILAYNFYHKEWNLNYKLSKVYTYEDKKLYQNFQKVRSCLPLNIANCNTYNGKINCLRKYIMDNWRANVKSVLEKRGCSESLQQPAKPALSKKKKKILVHTKGQMQKAKKQNAFRANLIGLT